MPTKSQNGRSRSARTKNQRSKAATPKKAPAKTAAPKKAPAKTAAPARRTATVNNPRNRVRMWRNNGIPRTRAARVGSGDFSNRVEAAYRGGGMDAANREFSNLTNQNKRADAYEKFRNRQTWGDSGIRRSTINNRIAKTGKKNGQIAIKKGGKTYTIRYWTGKGGSISTSPVE